MAVKFNERRQNIRKLNKNIVVLYHKDCTDGFSAAWAVWKKFGGKADYAGIDPGSQPLKGLKNKEIYMVDVIYPAKYLDKLIKDNKKVVAIDHHISNKDAFDIIGNGIFDNDHSAAVLSWKYFHPKVKVPRFLKHVEDMDLWRFNMPETKEIISFLELLDFGFREWSKVVRNMENKFRRQEYVKSGSFILKYQDVLIERIISNHAVKVVFEGHKTYAVNSPMFNSQIGNSLHKKLPPIGITWSQKNNGTVSVSLRSNGSVDVSKLAAKFGGGGHNAAAAFQIKNCSKLPWKKI